MQLSGVKAVGMVLLLVAPLMAHAAKASLPERGPALNLPEERCVVAAKVIHRYEEKRELIFFGATLEVTEVFSGTGITKGDRFIATGAGDDPNLAMVLPVPNLGEESLWRLYGRDNANWHPDRRWSVLDAFPARKGVDGPDQVKRAETVANMLKQVTHADPDRRLSLLATYLGSNDRYLAAEAARVIGGDVFMPGSKYKNKGQILEQLIQKPSISVVAAMFLDIAACDETGIEWQQSPKRIAILKAAMVATETEDDEIAIGERFSHDQTMGMSVLIVMMGDLITNKKVIALGDDHMMRLVSTIGTKARTPAEHLQAFEFLSKLIEETDQLGVRLGCAQGLSFIAPLNRAELERVRLIAGKMHEELVLEALRRAIARTEASNKKR